jgi:hypothetical protein
MYITDQCNSHNITEPNELFTDDDHPTISSSVSTESTPSAVSVVTQAASGIPSDIANCTNDGPTQLRNHKFPSTLFSNRFRSFSPLWFDTYPWLEYPIERDAVYCYPCHFFTYGQQRCDNPFVITGFSNWKKAVGRDGKLEKHHTSEKNQQAMSSWSDHTVNVTRGTSVASSLIAERQQQVSRNRHYMKSILACNQILLISGNWIERAPRS